MSKRKRKTANTPAVQSTDPEVFIWHTCKNCNYSFEGLYCPSCGQSVQEVQRPISHFLGDMFGALFAFDLRLFRSLPVLLFKPGILSSEYVAGKRKKFVAPFRLFFFTSVIFFFLIGWHTNQQIEQLWNDPEFVLSQDSSGQTAAEINSRINGQDTLVAISSLKDGLNLMTTWRNSIQAELNNSTLSEDDKLDKMKQLQAFDDPEVVMSKLYQYISWSFFVLMPWFASILFVFFRKRRKYYSEHLIFAVNLHTFFFVLLILVVVLSMIVPNLMSGMGGWIFLFGLVYAFIGIRNFYEKKWLSSFFSTIAIFLIYLFSILMLIVAGIVLAIAIF